MRVAIVLGVKMSRRLPWRLRTPVQRQIRVKSALNAGVTLDGRGPGDGEPGRLRIVTFAHPGAAALLRCRQGGKAASRPARKRMREENVAPPSVAFLDYLVQRLKSEECSECRDKVSHHRAGKP